LLDGVNIKTYTLSSLRKLMGIVSQAPVLFNDTIYNNIAFGMEGMDKEKVEEAARIANAHDFIMATEQRYQTNIGDGGGKLSGGQRQRLTIARAILKNPPILILDEATSALDAASERLVQDALNHLMEHRTTIVIAHRLSTIKHADEIIVLEKGRIAQRGSHKKLIEEEGIYKRLLALQGS
jgi:subfamily B ATP-binding cassette protein MsbA